MSSDVGRAHGRMRCAASRGGNAPMAAGLSALLFDGAIQGLLQSLLGDLGLRQVHVLHLAHVAEDPPEPQHRASPAVPNLPRHGNVLQGLVAHASERAIDVHRRHLPDRLQEHRQRVLEGAQRLAGLLVSLLLVLLAALASLLLPRHGRAGHVVHLLHCHRGPANGHHDLDSGLELVGGLLPRRGRVHRVPRVHRGEELLGRPFVNASDCPQQSAAERGANELRGLLARGPHEANLVPAENQPVELLAKVLRAAHLAPVLLPLQPFAFPRVGAHLPFERLVHLPRRHVACLRLMLLALEVPLEVLDDMVGLHRQVQLADVLFELRRPEQHRKEQLGVDAGQRRVRDAILAHRVIALSQLRVAEYLVGLRELLEALPRLGVVRVLVGVHAEGGLVVRLLDVRGACRGGHADDVVVGGVHDAAPVGTLGLPALVLAVRLLVGILASDVGELLAEVTGVVDPSAELRVPPLVPGFRLLESFRRVVNPAGELRAPCHDAGGRQPHGGRGALGQAGEEALRAVLLRADGGQGHEGADAGGDPGTSGLEATEEAVECVPGPRGVPELLEGGAGLVIDGLDLRPLGISGLASARGVVFDSRSR
mmetsp:Transcript_49193/g.143206  ORF Transcript_49193/g.143206 Transcript_49193/m.143206 type:complete len:596 (+) Transcript_49193:98-1885(+)